MCFDKRKNAAIAKKRKGMKRIQKSSSSQASIEQEAKTLLSRSENQISSSKSGKETGSEASLKAKAMLPYTMAISKRGIAKVADLDDEDKLSVSEKSIADAVDDWLERMLQKGVEGLSKEFVALRSKSKPSKQSCSTFTANQDSGRNRYRNVVCLNESRVKLRDHPSGNDYIHANYVATPFGKRRFICTQAPLDNTIHDFWFMVVQERVQYIVMLTGFVEHGYIKSAQYFPFATNIAANYGGIIVKCLKCKRRMDFDCEVWERTLIITFQNTKPLTVTHFHWTDWPDHGVPQSYSCPLLLLEQIRMSISPIVLHCSAGIGRTGCMVLIELVLERLQFKLSCTDMDLVLLDLRKQRADFIQNVAQYLYVHRTLLEYFITSGRIKATDEVHDFIQNYNHYIQSLGYK